MRHCVIRGPRGARWQVDLPTTAGERMRGLRGRRLDSHEAMLFERRRAVHTIGMTFPITVVFVDASWRVIGVTRSKAGTIVSCRRARHVLECHIGADVRLGDQLSQVATPGERATRGAPDIARPMRT